MSSFNTQRQDFGGAATSCAKLNGRFGRRERKRLTGDVSAARLIRDINAGYRHFVNKRGGLNIATEGRAA